MPDPEIAAGPVPSRRWLCVSLHDVAPATWPHCQKVLDAVREVADIPLTLLVVPAYHGACSALPLFESAMSAQWVAGHELALHGYFHRDSEVPNDVVDWFRRRIYTAGEGEFCGLSETEATERLNLGRRWFDTNGWPLAGFIAPAWLLGPGAWRALRARDDLQYTSTLTQLIALPEAQAIRAPCLTYSVRSAWRRPTSIVWNTLLAAATARTPVLRLGLHPRDAESKAVRRSWQRLLERALTDRSAVTKAECVRQWRLQNTVRPMDRSLPQTSPQLQERGLLDSR
ncbi:MAG TPA: polysaccharide deacetylase family protein [Burkholderiaceae bacterium]|nr:polysaccharide deacetylase family protein [Burkholderiaceae bacterium]